MIRFTRSLFLAALAGTLTLGGPASAAPPRMPVQGVLTTIDGAAIAGRLPVDFALYTASEGGEAIWRERQSVDFDRGFFSAMLGAVEPLDAALFAANDVVWLGVTVDDDEEMSRVELGTAPFASFAVLAGDASTVQGRAADSFAAAQHRHDWSALDAVPADLADGDDDTTYDAAPGGGLELIDGAFALLSGCGEGELLKRGGGGWICAVDATGASIAAFGLDGTVLGITEGDTTRTVDLAALATDLDASNELLQGIGLEGTVLRVSDAGGAYTVDLAALIDDADADPTNEANTDLALEGTTLALTDALSTLRVDLAALVDDADADPTNEANTDLALEGTTLALTDALGTLRVDLASLGDDADPDPTNEANTDLALEGTTLALTDALGTLRVDLASLGDDADPDPTNEANTDLALEGTTLALTDALGTLSVDLASLGDDADADPTNEANTDLALEGTTLALTDALGTLRVDLAALVDDADPDPTNEANTELTLVGTTLAVTDALGTLSVDLASLVDDADADPTNEANTELTLVGTTLAVTDALGTLSVDLASLGDDADPDPTNEANTELTLVGTTLAVTDALSTLSVDLASLVDDADADPSNELQDLSLAGDTLGLSASDAQVDLSPYLDNTDAQTLSVDGTDLSVSGGNTVSLASLQDDLGSHQATRNLTLDGYWLSYDGTDSGLYVDAVGAVGIGTSTPVAALDVVGDIHVEQALVASANSARAASIDAGNTSVNRVYQPSANTRIWQSFTVTTTGLITQVQVHLDSSPVTGGVLEIYEGEGTDGALLFEQGFVDENNGRRTIVLDTPVAVAAGEQYTLRLTNTAAAWEWRFNQADVYDGGRGSQNANEDMDFRIYVTGDPVLVGVDDAGAISVADGAISVDVNGQVGIGTTAPAYALQVGEAGDGTEARANGWNVFSDARLKTDVKPIADPLARLEAIHGYTYAWKAGADQRRQAGVIAQEVEAVLPEVVTVDADGLRAVDYGKLNALLIEAVKAQQRLIDAQGAELDAVRAENAEIREALGLW